MKESFVTIFASMGIITAAVLTSWFLINNDDSAAVYKDDTVSTSSTASLETKISVEGAVTVMVTPIKQTDWSFRVVLDTHSGELADDLTQVSILTDENGAEYRPIAWDGDAPGGHHRSGVLVFGGITPSPESIVLTMRQIGGVDERKFEWINQR